MKKVVLTTLFVVCASCGGSVIQRIDYATPSPGRGVIHFDATPTDAEIYVDGAYMGLVERYAGGRMPIKIGIRRIKINRPGYYAWYAVKTIKRETVRLKVRLVPHIHNNRYRDAGHEIQTGLE